MPHLKSGRGPVQLETRATTYGEAESAIDCYKKVQPPRESRDGA